jgi:sulfate transport system ATP-binding protein
MERRYPAQLSGGQRQRVALARALAVEPRVLLLDEPLGALDAKVRKDLRRWLRELHDRTGHTTVFVTHDQDEALELADRVAILNSGRIEQVGTPDEVYDAPASPFVMAFVGDTTSMPVEVHDGQASFAGKPITADLLGNAEGAARLYLRPGDAVLVKPDGADLAGSVIGVRRTATGRRVHVRLDPGGAEIEVEAAASRAVSVGEQVGVRILKGRLFAPG